MDDPREREAQIFADALALPRAERARFLDDACGGDADLRQRIELLVQAHDSAGGFMTGPPFAVPPGGAEAATSAPAPAEVQGAKIGRYKLLQKLGEGGCGIVWMAEQEEPVRRRVALKIIKLGMDTREVIARFDAERQALALMDHINIARVLDAGATDAGRPFFAMELVRGTRITDYCDEHNLTMEQRLELFSQVCHAVQHAHQKGVIHRDLKPSNILVTLHDGVPIPKVIDFGIAKATQGRLTDLTLFTAFEQFIGTPAYMSPEQAEMSSLDIDTRSDIYSLGVLLYELLTGRTPFEAKDLMQAGLDEMRRLIREVEPPPPSTRLSTLTDADRSTVAKLRGTAPAKLSSSLRGDLDWIVMRCLEKDRTRRYETPTALADDIARHLNNEPVVASPPSNAYRLGKFIRRNRLLFGAAAAVAVALVSGTIISTWQAVRAARAERVASVERARAVEERARAEDLLTFMLGDLRAQLDKVGRLDVLESVGDKAMTYFAALNPRDLTDLMLARHAKALTQIGEIRMAQTRYVEAAAAFAEAHSRAAALAARHPSDGNMLFERSQAEYWNGFVHWQRGELTAAGDWLARYHETCVALVALDPARPAWQNELACSLHNLAALRTARREFAAARADFLAELVTLEKMRGSNPGDLELRLQIAEVHSRLGEVADHSGEFAEALNQYVTHTKQLEQLVEVEPATARWRLLLSHALIFQTGIHLATGQLAAAADRLKEARRLLDELVNLDSANRLWRGYALHARLAAAMLARCQGDTPEATRLLDELCPQLEQLLMREPTDGGFTRWLTTAWRLQAQERLAAGRPDAMAAAARAVELGEKLARNSQATNEEVGECALAGVVAGEIAVKAGDAAAARRHWQRAMDLLAPRLPGSRDRRLLDPAARALAWLGRMDEAHATIAQLNLLGYVPPDPWPEAARREPAGNSHP